MWICWKLQGCKRFLFSPSIVLPSPFFILVFSYVLFFSDSSVLIGYVVEEDVSVGSRLWHPTSTHPSLAEAQSRTVVESLLELPGITQRCFDLTWS